MSEAIIAKLVEAGTPAALIAEVAMALGRAQMAVELLEGRRAKDRARKSIPRNSTESEENAEIHSEPLSLDKSPPHTPLKINPIPCVRLTREGRFHRMPEGWKPTKPLPAPLQAKVDQWPPGALGDETAALKRWAANAEDKNGKGRKLDWDKAHWNWLGRRHDERYGKQQHHSDLGKSFAGATAAFGHPSTWREDQPF